MDRDDEPGDDAMNTTTQTYIYDADEVAVSEEYSLAVKMGKFKTSIPAPVAIAPVFEAPVAAEPQVKKSTMSVFLEMLDQAKDPKVLREKGYGQAFRDIDGHEYRVLVIEARVGYRAKWTLRQTWTKDGERITKAQAAAELK
jgi:hypothetical protein